MARPDGFVLQRDFGIMRYKLSLVRCLLTATASLSMLTAPVVWAQQVPDVSRLVTLGGSVTEIVYALGEGHRIIGTDQSSIYPPEATELPSVGYYRKLPSEGVVSLQPSLIVASEHAGPPEVIAQLKQLGIPVVMVSDKPDMESLRTRVQTVAQALGKREQGESLLRQMETALDSVKKTEVPELGAMTIVMRGGKLLGAGHDTAANVVLETAGLKNVLSQQSAYRPLSAEVVSALAPEVIIVTSSTVDSMGGLDKVKQSPVISMTPAVRNARVIVLDDMLAQGFGLRFPQAIAQVQDGVMGATN